MVRRKICFGNRRGETPPARKTIPASWIIDRRIADPIGSLLRTSPSPLDRSFLGPQSVQGGSSMAHPFWSGVTALIETCPFTLITTSSRSCCLYHERMFRKRHDKKPAKSGVWGADAASVWRKLGRQVSAPTPGALCGRPEFAWNCLPPPETSKEA